MEILKPYTNTPLGASRDWSYLVKIAKKVKIRLRGKNWSTKVKLSWHLRSLLELEIKVTLILAVVSGTKSE